MGSQEVQETSVPTRSSGEHALTITRPMRSTESFDSNMRWNELDRS